jgi:hypothetical protein
LSDRRLRVLDAETPNFNLMKIITTDSGFHLDDPNNRWGDPGYVPAAAPVNQPPTKRKRMKRNLYFPPRKADLVNWLVNYMNKLPNWATALGLSPVQVSAATADCLWLI